MPDPFRTETFTYGHSAALRLSCAASAGVLLDRLLGEVWRWHLRVGFGRLAGAVKTRPNRGPLRGVSRLLAWALVVLPWVALTFWAKRGDLIGWLIDVLAETNLHVDWIVSRDTSELYENGVASACVETTLENVNDETFETLFWFILYGAVANILGQLEQRTQLGEGRPAPGEDFASALSLVRRSIGLWLAVFLLNGATCA